MTAEIFHFAPPINVAANFLRLSHNNHRIVEDLHAGNRLRAKRVVAEAQYVGKQLELLQALNATGTDLVLDTKFAELSHEGSYQSTIRKLPWADKNKPHDKFNFNDRIIRSHARKIAEFAVEHRFSSVISPSHVIDSANDEWLNIDSDFYFALREELDSNNGKEIGLDYMLIAKNLSLLDDETNRKAIVSKLQNLSYINLWMKVGGFGSDSTPAALRRYINCAWDLQSLGKPLVADLVGGIVGLSLLAFNAVGGISHGIGIKERFSLRSWTHRSNFSGSLPKRYYFDSLDIHLPIKKAIELVEGRRGAASLLLCNDKECCKRGRDSMKNHSEEHFLIQRDKQIREISRFVGNKRTEHFMDNMFQKTLDSSLKVEKLKIEDKAIKTKISKHNRRLERMDTVLRDLHMASQIEPDALIPNRCKVNYLQT